VKSVVLDETDHRIINRLVRNGRVSYAALGEEVGLSPHGAADRVRRLEKSGVITGFTAVVDLENLGRGLDAFVDVRLLPTADPDAFERLAASLQPVREILFVTGRFDYQLRVACTDADELDRTVRALRQRGGAAATETRIVLRARTHVT
jgi:Lrp/AsnC family transcriptional regulator, leucine-responsive regulatory protein